MDAKLREAWTKLVRPDDYDAHMAAVGQAEANARLVAELFKTSPPDAGAKILFAGAGTGQLFDYAPPDFLNPYRTTFTDINAEYLSRLKARLSAAKALKFEMIVDDIENSQLPANFELALAILVLEQVDFRKEIATLCRLSKRRAFVVLQENPADLAGVLAKGRTIPRSMEVFAEVHPKLIPQSDVVAEFSNHGFALRRSTSRDVPDSKKMIALEFEKRR